MVGPHTQQVVGPLLPDLARNLLPAAHGVEGHDAAPGQSMRSSSGMAVISLDLLSTAVWASTRRLASAQAPIRVQRLQAPAPVVGTAHALAVDGHHLAPGQFEGRLHPVPEAFLEAGRVQPGEDPSQRVVRGDAVRQGQEGAQPLLVEPAERAMATKLSAPQMMASTDSTRMSVRGCSLVRSTRKSPGCPWSRPGTGCRVVHEGCSAGWIRNRPL